jgi:hypothetical protein
MVGGVFSEWRNQHCSIYFLPPVCMCVCSEVSGVVNKIQGLTVGLGEGHPVPY